MCFMDERRVTLKDIASKLNVSLGTVHRAIYNKKGVGDDTRKEILKTAEEIGYRVNIAASTLKRKPIRVAVILPEPINDEKYFYQYIWKGIDGVVEDLKDFNIEVLKCPFTGSYQNQIEVFENVYSDNNGNLDGLLTLAWHETKVEECINKYVDSGIPVVTVNADAPNSRRIGCVSAPAYKAGMLAGELMSNLVPQRGKVIVVGGNRELKNHQETVLGFIRSLKDSSPEVEILELYEFHSYNNRLYTTLNEFLTKFDDIVGIYSNNSRNTIPMCKVVKDLDMADCVKVIGSDIFEESIEFLNKRIMKAIIYQNPYMQAYQGFKMLFNYITTNQKPPEHEYTNISIIMRNNLENYI